MHLLVGCSSLLRASRASATAPRPQLPPVPPLPPRRHHGRRLKPGQTALMTVRTCGSAAALACTEALRLILNALYTLGSFGGISGLFTFCAKLGQSVCDDTACTCTGTGCFAMLITTDVHTCSYLVRRCTHYYRGMRLGERCIHFNAILLHITP